MQHNSAVLGIVCSWAILLGVGASAQNSQVPDDSDYLPVVSAGVQEHEPDISTGDNDNLLESRAAMIRQRGPLVQLSARQKIKEAGKQRTQYPDHFGSNRSGKGWWRPLGPFGERSVQNGSMASTRADSGRLRTILSDPSDEQAVYVLTSGGGLWRTTNFDDPTPDWTPLTDYVGTTSGGAVAFGGRSKVLYLGLGDPFGFPGGAVVKSSNKGQTWSEPLFLGNAICVMDLKVDTGQSQDIVLVGTDDGLFRSSDSGDSYTQVAFAGKQVWSLAKTSAGWLATVQEPDSIFGQLRKVGIPSTRTSRVFLSTDNGRTWSATGIGIPSYAGRTTLAVGVPGDSTVFAIAAWFDDSIQDWRQLDLFRSIDGGKHFNAVGLDAKVPTNAFDGFLSGHDLNLLADQPWYNQMLLVDPSDTTRNTVYLGGEFSSAKTVDGGQTWRLITDWALQANLPYAHPDFHCAAIRISRSGKTLILGNDGGLFTSTDDGVTFDSGQKNQGLQTHLIYSLASGGTSPSSTLIGTQDNGTRFSPGGPWYNTVIGNDGMGTAWSQANDFAALGTFQGNVILRSINNPPDSMSKFHFDVSGISDFFFNTFTGLTAPDAGSDPSGQIFFTWSPSRLYISVDATGRWFTFARINWGFGGNIHLGAPFEFVFRDVIRNIGVGPNDPQLTHLAAVLNRGRVLITNNSADSFSVVNLQTEVPGYTSFNSNATWANQTDLYISSVQYAPGVVRVAKSNNAGAPGSWIAAQDGLPDLPITRLLLDSRDPSGQSLFAATDLGVYRTTDAGAHWRLFGKGLPQVAVLDLYMPPSGSFLRIGTYGRGVWEIDLSGKSADY